VVDRDLLLRRVALLEEYIGQLREYAQVSADAYATDWKTQLIVERTLQLAIEACTDVCQVLEVRFRPSVCEASLRFHERVRGATWNPDESSQDSENLNARTRWPPAVRRGVVGKSSMPAASEPILQFSTSQELVEL